MAGATTAEARADGSHPAGDATPVARLARRDGGLVLAALALWAATDAWVAATGLGVATALSVVVGAVVGHGLAARAHEWGHLLGARGAGGVAPTRGYSSFFPIFDLDLVKSSESAFRAMSLGGSVGHWLAVALLALALPLDVAGRVALVGGAFAQAVAASLTEWPVIARSYRGASPVESFRGLTGASLRRDERVGYAAGALLFLLLV